MKGNSYMSKQIDNSIYIRQFDLLILLPLLMVILILGAAKLRDEASINPTPVVDVTTESTVTP